MEMDGVILGAVWFYLKRLAPFSNGLDVCVLQFKPNFGIICDEMYLFVATFIFW